MRRGAPVNSSSFDFGRTAEAKEELDVSSAAHDKGVQTDIREAEVTDENKLKPDPVSSLQESSSQTEAAGTSALESSTEYVVVFKIFSWAFVTGDLSHSIPTNPPVREDLPCAIMLLCSILTSISHTLLSVAGRIILPIILTGSRAEDHLVRAANLPRSRSRNNRRSFSLVVCTHPSLQVWAVYPIL